MPMTLRLPDELNDALRDISAVENRSMQQTAILAVREYIERRDRRNTITSIAEQAARDYPETLRRLGE